MQELCQGERICFDELGTPHRFEYYLLVEELMLDGVRHEDFGVMLRSDDGDCAGFRHITTDRNRIENLLALLHAQQVSPTHLQDILEDWL